MERVRVGGGRKGAVSLFLVIALICQTFGGTALANKVQVTSGASLCSVILGTGPRRGINLSGATIHPALNSAEAAILNTVAQSALRRILDWPNGPEWLLDFLVGFGLIRPKPSDPLYSQWVLLSSTEPLDSDQVHPDETVNKFLKSEIRPRVKAIGGGNFLQHEVGRARTEALVQLLVARLKAEIEERDSFRALNVHLMNIAYLFHRFDEENSITREQLSDALKAYLTPDSSKNPFLSGQQLYRFRFTGPLARALDMAQKIRLFWIGPAIFTVRFAIGKALGGYELKPAGGQTSTKDPVEGSLTLRVERGDLDRASENVWDFVDSTEVYSDTVLSTEDIHGLIRKLGALYPEFRHLRTANISGKAEGRARKAPEAKQYGSPGNPESDKVLNAIVWLINSLRLREGNRHELARQMLIDLLIVPPDSIDKEFFPEALDYFLTFFLLGELGVIDNAYLREVRKVFPGFSEIGVSHERNLIHLLDECPTVAASLCRQSQEAYENLVRTGKRISVNFGRVTQGEIHEISLLELTKLGERERALLFYRNLLLRIGVGGIEAISEGELEAWTYWAIQYPFITDPIESGDNFIDDWAIRWVATQLGSSDEDVNQRLGKTGVLLALQNRVLSSDDPKTTLGYVEKILRNEGNLLSSQEQTALRLVGSDDFPFDLSFIAELFQALKQKVLGGSNEEEAIRMGVRILARALVLLRSRDDFDTMVARAKEDKETIQLNFLPVVKWLQTFDVAIDRVTNDVGLTLIDNVGQSFDVNVTD